MCWPVVFGWGSFRRSTALGAVLPCRSGGSGWLARRQGLQAGDGGGDLAGSGPSLGEAEPEAAAGAGEPSGDREDPQPEAFRLPAAGSPLNSLAKYMTRISGG
jgi:hypothetical protein